jgi:hypothetical protein
MRFILTRSVLLLLFFVSLSSAAWAQGVFVDSVDLAGTIGFNSHSGIDNSLHPSFTGSGAYNLWGKLAAFGELGYQSAGSTLATKESITIAGGGVRYYFKQFNRIAPYVVGAGGFNRLNRTTIGQGVNNASNGGYFGGGGGASLYLNENFGIRPELRYQRELIGVASSFNEVQGSVSVFFQFGGSAPSSKK